MILYFSGTGNSEYAAKRIAAELQDEAVNLFHKIRRNDCSKINSETPWVIVTPTCTGRSGPSDKKQRSVCTARGHIKRQTKQQYRE